MSLAIRLAKIARLLDRPLITSDLDPSLGPNIQGPSLIRVPGTSDPLGPQACQRVLSVFDGRIRYDLQLGSYNEN